MKYIDLPLLIVVILLTLFGVLMVYNASSVVAVSDFGDKYHFLREQSVWAMLGFMLLFICANIDYHIWYKLAFPFLMLSIILLGLVFVPGIGISFLGASRWIDLGFVTIQPAELAKLSIVIYLSAWLHRKEKGRFFAFLLLFLFVVGMVILQPDMGTAMILAFTFLSLYFLSGAKLLQFAVLVPIFLGAAAFFIIREPYRLSRILTFFNVDRDPLGASYHVRQTLIALGTGGLTGQGIGQSLQKYAYLPEGTTDSIFAIIAEELGFFGATIVIALFAFLILRGIKISSSTNDPFGRLLGLGIVSFLAIQVIINISAVVSLIPFTGVPLPFISYGGSSLLVNLTSIGILLNISKKS